MLKRRQFTAAVVTAAEDSNFAIGLVHAPDGVAWSKEPNRDSSTFTPYGVITPGASQSPTGSIGADSEDWRLPYSIISFGVLPDQAEYVADEIRTALRSLKNESIAAGDETYRVQQVKIESIGGIQRVDTPDPSYFGQTDVVTVWITKETV